METYAMKQSWWLSGLLVLFVGAPINASIPEELARAWTCQGRVLLKSDTQHFFIYGQDAWHGRLPLRCLRGVEEQSVWMDLVFQSQEGFGIDDRKALPTNLRLSTQVNPDRLKLRAIVVDSESHQDLISWQFSSQRTAGEVFVHIEPSAARRSLASGVLFVMPVGPYAVDL
jgi:hypothetical protein